MDLTPFLEINMKDIKEVQANELKKFSKETFDTDNIFSTASELKYSTLIKTLLTNELEAFYIVRGILAGTIPIEDVVYRDTESYFGILYRDNNRKPLCRINLDTKNKQLLIPDENKNFERIYIYSLNDIYSNKDKLITVAKRYLEK